MISVGFWCMVLPMMLLQNLGAAGLCGLLNDDLANERDRPPRP
jgi:hypothetical protein